MTDRLYYDDSYLRRFEALVIERRRVRGEPAFILDRSAFYPDSGGQPHDTGSLAGARVLGVEEDVDGGIVHLLDSEPAPGWVEGCIDWERRFDHMQQHTGQHVLSQAFLQVANAATLSFHLGQETSTIDVGLADPDPAVLRSAEELASRIVFESRPVRALTVEKSDLGTLHIRKETRREGPIRVIEIEEFDRSACGGTHVRRTSEIGVIAVLGGERYKGGTRVEFVCGWRALRTLRREHEVLREAGRISSTHPCELPRLVERLIAERAALARENARLREEALAFEAADLVRGAPTRGGIALVRRTLRGRDVDGVKRLAQKVVSLGKAVALFGLDQDPAQVVAARSAESPGHCGKAVQETAALLGGRGGGRPEQAQAGGIPPGALENWLDQLESRLGLPDDEEKCEGSESG